MSDPEVKSTTLISPVSPLGYPTNLLAPGQTYETVNRTIGDIPLKRAPAILVGGLHHRFIVAVDVFGRRHMAVIQRRRNLGR